MSPSRAFAFLILASAIGCNVVDVGDSTPDASQDTQDRDAAPDSSDPLKDGGSFDAQIDGSPEPDASVPDAGPLCQGKCPVGHACDTDADCEFGCSYNKKCVEAPSCKTHLGGDTCGMREVGQADSRHESCCRSLEVKGFSDPSHPGKKVFLDKYEITAGRVREWVRAMTLARGMPNIKSWIAQNRPAIWDPAWDKFLPTDFEGEAVLIGRRLLGDPRPEDYGWGIGPGVIPPPPTDEYRRMGINYQFGGEVYVDLHGMNCGTYAGSYGFPTYYYPPDIMVAKGELPRPSGMDHAGNTIPPQDLLDVKSMNCITNAMLAAFCAWDGGQLATTEVLDFITDTPASLGNTSGCGSQYDNHGDLLGGFMGRTVQQGGRCQAVISVNATFDAGDALPTPGSQLNQHNYHFPDIGNVTHDKSWQISAPGRANTFIGMQTDFVRTVQNDPGEEPWMDIHGNLNEAALETVGGTFTGRFGLKYRGIGYGSSRSDLNMTLMRGETIIRIQRPEAKAAYTGGRCMRFK